MKKKSVSWLVIGVLLIIMPLLAACGGEAPAPAPPPAPAPAPAPAPTPAPAVVPTAIPHPLEGRSDCLMCHGETGVKPFPTDHAGRTSDTCTTCHQPAG